jgi:dethiobiotin synthetase
VPTPRGVFVTGTDTDVGKTVVAVGLVRSCVRLGMRVAVYKPVEAGAQTDALGLWEASGRLGPQEDVCRVRLALPAAPAVAAHEEGRAVGAADLLDGFRRQASRADVVVVEGAGGLLVPLAQGYCVADLAGDIGLPLLVVARDALGTINHTLLTLEAARTRSLPVAGVVLNRVYRDPDPTTRTNRATLLGLTRLPVLGPFPHLDFPTIEASADAAASIGMPHLLEG